MSMSCLYTTAESIRAALGVSTSEFENERVAALNVEAQLRVLLEEWLPDHADYYNAGVLDSAVAAERTLSKLLGLYCQYRGAQVVADGLHMIALQKLADGANEGQRFQRESLQTTQASIAATAEMYKSMILKAILGEDTAAAYAVFGISSPDYDPVVGGTP